MTKLKSLIAFTLLTFTPFVCSLYAQEKPTAVFIKDINENQSNWPTMTGQTYTIDGRLSVVGRESLKFLKSELNVYFSRDIVPPQRSGRLEVTGEFKRVNGEIAFVATRLRGVPTEFDYLDLRMRAMSNPTVEDLYEMARWGQEHSTFYDDALLADLVVKIRNRAITLARSLINADDGPALLEVAAKAAQENVDSESVQSMTHEALRLIWQNRQPASFDYEKFRNQLTSRLPGASVPPERISNALVQQYNATPIKTYQAADGTSRAIMERIFYQDVVKSSLQSQLRSDGSNGQLLSGQAVLLLPEEPEFAHDLLMKYMDYRFSALKSSSRQQAIDLAETYRKQGDNKTAEDVINTWLAYRAERLSMDNVADIVTLSEDYITLANDRAHATELLDRGIRKHPGAPEIEDRLKQFGYIKIDDTWLTPGQAAALPKDPIREAMKQGVIALGMTRPQVYQTLGKPTSIAKAYSSGGTNESWTYTDAKLTIRFDSDLSRSEPTVKEISPVHQLR